MMSLENDLGVTGTRLLWANRRARHRDLQEEVLGGAFKIMICILVLLEVPWTMIGAIALGYTKLKTKSRSSPDWPSEKIKRIARQGLALMPNLPHIIDDFNHPQIHMARKWLAECKLAMWCLHQNQKGIAVPTTLAIDNYMSFWGMGPHIEKVRLHLNQFNQKKRRANWMQHFKKVWDFDLSICGRACSLAAAEIATKAPHMENFKPDSREKKNNSMMYLGSGSGPNSGTIFCAQNWNQFVVLVCFYM